MWNRIYFQWLKTILNSSKQCNFSCQQTGNNLHFKTQKVGLAGLKDN